MADGILTWSLKG